jgi:hypothetical protein
VTRQGAAGWRRDEAGVDFSSERVGRERKIHLKMVRLDEPILAVVAAVQIDPIHGAFGKSDFARYVAGKRDADDERMLKPAAEGSESAVEIAAWEFFLEWRGASRDAIEFDGGAGRVAGDFEGLRGERNGCAEEEGSEEEGPMRLM